MNDWIKKYLVVLATLLLIFAFPGRTQNPSSEMGQPSNLVQIHGLNSANDPCGSWGTTKQSTAVTISTATTTQIVALTAGQTIFVCGFNFSMTGTTAPTFQFEYGTGTNCGTGTTVLTGVYAADITATIGQYIYGGGEMTIFATASANALCIVTGGTGPSLQGVVTFVQRVAGT